jgi:hypothetical protein
MDGQAALERTIAFCGLFARAIDEPAAPLVIERFG